MIRLLPLTVLLPSTRQRRYKSSLVHLVSLMRFPSLSEAEKSNVRGEVIEICKPFSVYPWWQLTKNPSVIAMASERAVAMRNLKISTGIPTLTWDNLFHPWHKNNVVLLRNDFRLFSTETDAAITTLKTHGAEFDWSFSKAHNIDVAAQILEGRINAHDA